MKREFVLSEAQEMLPLIRKILADVQATSKRVNRLHQQRSIIDDCRHSDRYEVRRECHLVDHQIERAERELDDYAAELRQLGVVLLNPNEGIVGFPFLWSPTATSKRIRKALFLYKLSDSADRSLRTWRFMNERRERRIPTHWVHEYVLRS